MSTELRCKCGNSRFAKQEPWNARCLAKWWHMPGNWWSSVDEDRMNGISRSLPGEVSRVVNECPDCGTRLSVNGETGPTYEELKADLALARRQVQVLLSSLAECATTQDCQYCPMGHEGLCNATLAESESMKQAREQIAAESEATKLTEEAKRHG